MVCRICAGLFLCVKILFFSYEKGRNMLKRVILIGTICLTIGAFGAFQTEGIQTHLTDNEVQELAVRDYDLPIVV